MPNLQNTAESGLFGLATMAIAELPSGTDLLRAGKWAEARAVFAAELERQVSAESLLGFADSLWWLGNIGESIAYYKRAYAAFRRRGDAIPAATTAIALSITYKCCLGNQAAASGWLGRAQTAAAEQDPAPLQGWLWSLEAYLTRERDLRSATDLLERSLAYARQNGDRDLELISLADLGLVFAVAGRIDEGLQLVDEAMAGISAAEYARLDTVVFVCCIMLTACEVARDLPRATQWCQVADEITEPYGCPFLYAECRMLYGSILVARGKWDEAERQLLAAIRMTEGVFPSMNAEASACLAALCLRQGRIEEAEAILPPIEHEVASLFPAAAARLARGQTSMAIALLERRLRHEAEGSLEAVRALEMLVEAHLDAGKKGAAQAVLRRLNHIGCPDSWPEGAALANMAAGHAALAGEDDPAAAAHFERALHLFAKLDLPYETAKARYSIARAAFQTNPELAISEAQGAFVAFERLGAAIEADKTASLLRSLGVSSKPGPKDLGLLTKREQEVLSLVCRGMSNPEIAGRLFISRKTAAHHVSSVLDKLGLRNRSEAVAYATRSLVTK
jgi:ATP/maltotriose-dependent transcriptional regulator MalT